MSLFLKCKEKKVQMFVQLNVGRQSQKLKIKYRSLKNLLGRELLQHLFGIDVPSISSLSIWWSTQKVNWKPTLLFPVKRSLPHLNKSLFCKGPFSKTNVSRKADLPTVELRRRQLRSLWSAQDHEEWSVLVLWERQNLTQPNGSTNMPTRVRFKKDWCWIPSTEMSECAVAKMHFLRGY